MTKSDLIAKTMSCQRIVGWVRRSRNPSNPGGLRLRLIHPTARSHGKIIFPLLVFLLVTLFCTAGIWQMHRYHEKKQLLKQSKQHTHELPTSLLPLINQTQSLQFKNVTIEGTYQNDLTFLIQNKIVHGKVGFEVLTPLKIKGQQKLLLIDRGWIANLTLLQNEKNILSNEQEIHGTIKLLNDFQFTLGKNILDKNSFPMVIQKIDLNEMTQITNHEFFPFILRLDPQAPNGFMRDWIITTILPQRHLAYALQWFALALISIIGFICVLLKEKNHEPTP